MESRDHTTAVQTVAYRIHAPGRLLKIEHIAPRKFGIPIASTLDVELNSLHNAFSRQVLERKPASLLGVVLTDAGQRVCR